MHFGCTLIDVAEIRAQIPVCQRVTYLNTGWSGPSPRPVLDVIRGQLELESAEGPASPRALEVSHEIDAEARSEVAALLGASVGEIALLQNTTEGISVILNALHWEPGDEAITFGLEHPAVLMSTRSLERKGVTVKVLELGPSEAAESILAGLRSALGPRTRLICLSHVQYASGLRMPLADICHLVHPVGVAVLADGAQAAGQMPLDLPALGVDFYSMPGQKWLLGPDGVGALYVRGDRLRTLEPRNPYLTLRRGTDPSVDFSETSRRFELSTSSMALRAGFTEAIRFIQAAGLDQIQTGNRNLATRLKHELASLPGVTVASPMDPAASTGLVTVRLPGVAAPDAVRTLWARERIAARSIDELDAIRFSCHFFNTEEEIDHVVTALQTILRKAR